MAGKRRKKIVFRRSSPLTLAAVLAVAVLSTVALITLSAALGNAESNYDVLRQQAAALSDQNQQLSDRIANLGSVESAIQIAMEKLGLVDPDTIVIDPSN